MYTSARDAAGYATLRALREASSFRRRKRVCSLGCDVGEEEDALATTLASRSLDRGGFYIGEEPCAAERPESRSLSLASDVSHLVDSRDSEERLMGLCLPLDTSLIFSVQETRVECEEYIVQERMPDVVEERNDGFELHTLEDCLQCHSAARVAELRHARAKAGDCSGVG